MSNYTSDQFQRIGLYIKNNEPVNDYESDEVKVQLSHVNGKTNWFSLSDTQLKAIYKILESE